MTRPASILCVLAAIALGACSGGEAPPVPSGVWDGSVDTLSGERVVVTNHGTPLWSTGEEWRLVEEVRVGALDGDGPDVFGEIRAVEVDEEGRLYVLDSQAKEIRVFGEDGSFVRTIGRQGEGPGELAMPTGLAWGPSGALWVVDPRNARFTAFDAATGSVLEEHPRLAGFFAIPWPGGFDREGRLHDVGLRASGEPALLRLDSLLQPRDTLPLLRNAAEQIMFLRDGLPFMSMPDPLTVEPPWRPAWEGGMWVATGDRYALHRVDFAGDTVATVVLEVPPVPVAAAERDSALAAFQAVVAEIGARPERDPRIPANKSPIVSVHQDAQGYLWVRPSVLAGTPLGYDVFDPGARYLGRVQLPRGPSYARPAIRGDLLALAWTDATGVPHVSRYRIEGRASSQ